MKRPIAFYEGVQLVIESIGPKVASEALRELIQEVDVLEEEIENLKAQAKKMELAAEIADSEVEQNFCRSEYMKSYNKGFGQFEHMGERSRNWMKQRPELMKQCGVILDTSNEWGLNYDPTFVPEE